MGNTVTINGCQVAVVRGLIQESKDAAIVNSTNKELDLQKNALAMALAAAAGPKLQEQCSKLKPLKLGEVKVSDAFNLPCKSVLHCWIDSVKDLEKAIMECLHVVDQGLKYESVSFPALGTGNLKKGANDIAQCFLRSIEQYTSGQRGINLRKIRIIIFPSDESIYKEFKLVFMNRSTQTYNKFNREDPRKSSTAVLQHSMKFLNVDKEWKSGRSFMEASDEDSLEPALESLDKFSEEFWDVQAGFKKCLGSAKVHISMIYKVIIRVEWEKYKSHRLHVSKKLKMPGREIERLLWHGTDAETAVEIAKFSFNRSYAGKNATRYGKGCYFARDSSFSNNYASPNTTGERFMFQARVVVGNFTLGKEDLIDAPKTSAGDKYDSVVDDLQDPSIFVVFNDTAAYPEYLIVYQINNDTSA